LKIANKQLIMIGNWHRGFQYVTVKIRYFYLTSFALNCTSIRPTLVGNHFRTSDFITVFIEMSADTWICLLTYLPTSR